ncbi:MAG: cupin-like domain-containing protein [Nostoc sp. SerVER01]|nr:hypothetical protein [Nostoc sp. SerVER01]MDZ8023962.1 hypothetical protein [Nostoc sp. DedQUE11]MDZ8079244.1 hypothetical protein [Nostoc sp. DcaGUA01]
MRVQVRESILRIKNPPMEKFSEIWKQHQPLIIEDVANHWNAFKNWSHDYLIERCGTNLVPVRFFPTKKYVVGFSEYRTSLSLLCDLFRKIQRIYGIFEDDA